MVGIRRSLGAERVALANTTSTKPSITTDGSANSPVVMGAIEGSDSAAPVPVHANHVANAATSTTNTRPTHGR